MGSDPKITPPGGGGGTGSGTNINQGPPPPGNATTAPAPKNYGATAPTGPYTTTTVVSQNRMVMGSNPHAHYRVIEMVPATPTMICPYCGYTVCPIVTYEPSAFAWMLCVLVACLFLPFFFIGFLIGYCILVADAMQEPKYICPLCGNYIRVGIIL